MLFKIFLGLLVLVLLSLYYNNSRTTIIIANLGDKFGYPTYIDNPGSTHGDRYPTTDKHATETPDYLGHGHLNTFGMGVPASTPKYVTTPSTGIPATVSPTHLEEGSGDTNYFDDSESGDTNDIEYPTSTPDRGSQTININMAIKTSTYPGKGSGDPIYFDDLDLTHKYVISEKTDFPAFKTPAYIENGSGHSNYFDDSESGDTIDTDDSESGDSINIDDFASIPDYGNPTTTINIPATVTPAYLGDGYLHRFDINVPTSTPEYDSQIVAPIISTETPAHLGESPDATKEVTQLEKNSLVGFMCGTKNRYICTHNGDIVGVVFHRRAEPNTAKAGPKRPKQSRIEQRNFMLPYVYSAFTTPRSTNLKYNRVPTGDSQQYQSTYAPVQHDLFDTSSKSMQFPPYEFPNYLPFYREDWKKVEKRESSKKPAYFHRDL